MSDQQQGSDIAVLKERVLRVTEELADKVSKAEFEPVKLLVYGVTGLVLTAFFVALLKLVVIS